MFSGVVLVSLRSKAEVESRILFLTKSLPSSGAAGAKVRARIDELNWVLGDSLKGGK